MLVPCVHVVMLHHGHHLVSMPSLCVYVAPHLASRLHHQFVFMPSPCDYVVPSPSPHVFVAPSPSKDYLKVYIPNVITSILHTIVSHCCLRMTQTTITNQNNLSLTITSFHHHNRPSSLSFKKDTR